MVTKAALLKERSIHSITTSWASRWVPATLTSLESKLMKGFMLPLQHLVQAEAHPKQATQFWVTASLKMFCHQQKQARLGQNWSHVEHCSLLHGAWVNCHAYFTSKACMCCCLYKKNLACDWVNIEELLLLHLLQILFIMIYISLLESVNCVIFP